MILIISVRKNYKFYSSIITFNRLKAKGLICLIFLAVPLIVGLLLPYFLLKDSIHSGTMPRWFSPVSAISTGLLFGVSLLHLIPDCTGDMEDAFESANVKSDYPVSMMLIAVGFFIVTLVEICVTQCQKSRVNPSEVPDHTPGSISATGHGHSHSGEEGLTESVKLFENAKSESAIYTMLFGLSAHSIFEGLAIGLQDDNSKLWLLAMIVLVHKSLFALVIGLAALRSLPGIIKPAISMLVFSLSSPIGIAIGTIICHFSADSNGMDTAVAVLESISTGTFLFVVFIELLPDELKLREEGALKTFTLILIGFMMMAGLQALDAFSDG